MKSSVSEKFKPRITAIAATRAGKTWEKHMEEINKGDANKRLFNTFQELNQETSEAGASILLMILEMMVKNVKAVEGDIENMLKVADIEKKWYKEAFEYYGINDQKTWSQFQLLAKKQGLLLNYASKAIKSMAETANEVFTIADIEAPDLSQKSCPHLQKFGEKSGDSDFDAKEDNEFFAMLMVQASEANYDRVSEFLESVFGKQFKMGPVKTSDRVLQKIRKENVRPSRILDLIRGKYLVSTPKDLAAFIARVKRIDTENKNIVLKRLKNGFRPFVKGVETEQDYPRILLNFMVFNETIIEIQVGFEKISALSKIDHIFYGFNRAKTSEDCYEDY